jgi:hypothetical protein
LRSGSCSSSDATPILADRQVRGGRGSKHVAGMRPQKHEQHRHQGRNRNDCRADPPIHDSDGRAVAGPAPFSTYPHARSGLALPCYQPRSAWVGLGPAMTNCGIATARIFLRKIGSSTDFVCVLRFFCAAAKYKPLPSPHHPRDVPSSTAQLPLRLCLFCPAAYTESTLKHRALFP